MRSSLSNSQSSWLAPPGVTPSAASARQLTAASKGRNENAQQHTKRKFGPEYYIRISGLSMDDSIDGMIVSPLSVDGDGHNQSGGDSLGDSSMSAPTHRSAATSRATRARIPLPFIEPSAAVMPTWKSAPRRERDHYWSRIKAELFSLVDDRYLIDHCLLEPLQLMDQTFKSEFISYKLNLVDVGVGTGVTPPTPSHTQRTFTTHIDSVSGPTCTLPALQQRLKLIAHNPLYRDRLSLLKLDCTIGRMDAAAREAEEIDQEQRARNDETEAKSTRRGRRGRSTDKSPNREKSKSTQVKSKSPHKSTSPKKNSKVSSKLRGALAAGSSDAARHSSDSEEESPRRPKLTAFLRTEEEQIDAANLVRLEKAATRKLIRLFGAPKADQSPAPAPHKGVPLHLQSDWLERCINLVLVRSGMRTLIDEHAHILARRIKLLSPSDRRDLESKERAERESVGATFLPAELHPLHLKPNSYMCAQGVLKDVLRVSRRITDMVRRGEYTEGLHPHTGKTQLTVIIYDDDVGASKKKAASSAAAAAAASSSFLSRLFGWFTPAVLSCFMSFTRSPQVWSLEKVARARVDGITRITAEQARLRADLDRERDEKMNTLRDLQATHQLRVVNELEKQLEADIARIRQAHLTNVALEVSKIASEFERMQAELVEHYAGEHRELSLMHRRVETRKSAQLASELSRYQARRKEVLDQEHVPRLALLAHRLEAHDLFDACLEVCAGSLPTFVHDPVFLSPVLPPGTHRLLFSHATLADLKLVAQRQGISTEQLEKTVTRALSSNKIIDTYADPNQPPQNIIDNQQLVKHVQHLQQIWHGHISDTSQDDDSVTAAIADLSSKASTVSAGGLSAVSESDLDSFETAMERLFEFRAQSSVHSGDDVRQVRGLVKLINEMHIRRHVRDELHHRTAMIQQVLMHTTNDEEKEEEKKETHDDNNGESNDNRIRPSRVNSQQEHAHTVQKIIDQITKAYKGNNSMDATAALRAANMPKRATAPTNPSSVPTGASDVDSSSVAPPSNRSQLSRALFRELVRRVIHNLKLRAGWMEEDPASPTGVPTCLRISHNSKRITLVKPYRYGCLHSSIAFHRLDEGLPHAALLKHRWFFEVTIGSMDQGCAQVMVGFDIDARRDPDDEQIEPHDGMPITAAIRSAELLQREHEESLRSFERTQYDRFARALPMLAAATSSAGVAPVGPGSSESLARYIGGLLHAANEKAGQAQEAIQLQLLANTDASGNATIPTKQVRSVMTAAASQAAQNTLHFMPPAHLATHPAHSTPAHLTEALVAQQTHPSDPLATPFVMFPTAAYALPDLSSPPPPRLAQRASGVFWQSDGIVFAHGRSWQVGVGFGEGDVIGVGLDLATHQIYFVKNGVIFMGAKDGEMADAPVQMTSETVGQLPNSQRGPVIGEYKLMHKRAIAAHDATAPAPDLAPDTDQPAVCDAVDGGAPVSPVHSSVGASGSSRRIRLPLKKLPVGKSPTRRQQAALDAAIAASAAAGTQVSLLESTPTSSQQNTPRPNHSLDALTILKSPLLPADSDSMDPLARLEKANAELQHRLTITTGAQPQSQSQSHLTAPLTPTQPIVATPIEFGSPAPMTPIAATPMATPKSALGVTRGSITDMANRQRSMPLSPLNNTLSPLPRPGSPSFSSVPSSGRSVSPSPVGSAVGPPYRRRDRVGITGLVSQSMVATLQQAQQLQLEHQIASVAVLQTAAADVLSSAQQVYQANQGKMELLNAAIRSHTQPNAPVFDQIFAEKSALVDEARARGEAQNIYADLDQAAGLTRRARHREIESPGRSDEERTIVNASMGRDRRSADAVSDSSDVLFDHCDIDVTLRSSVVLGNEVAGLPSVLRASSFSSVPLYFARRFGVSLLLPAPRLHLPTLLTTQQLATVLALGVATLATSDSVTKSLQTVLHASNHQIIMNQALVRSAIANGFHRLKQGARVTTRAVEYTSMDEVSTTLGVSTVTSQPLSRPNRGHLIGVDLGGSASTPSASHLPKSNTKNRGPTPIASIARVATEARDKTATTTTDSLEWSEAGSSRVHANSLLRRQSLVDVDSSLLVAGRASYTLRPCICMYTSKVDPRVSVPAEGLSFASKQRQMQNQQQSGQRAFITANFEGPFIYPIQQFRPVKNAN